VLERFNFEVEIGRLDSGF